MIIPSEMSWQKYLDMTCKLYHNIIYILSNLLESLCPYNNFLDENFWHYIACQIQCRKMNKIKRQKSKNNNNTSGSKKWVRGTHQIFITNYIDLQTSKTKHTCTLYQGIPHMIKHAFVQALWISRRYQYKLWIRRM